MASIYSSCDQCGGGLQLPRLRQGTDKLGLKGSVNIPLLCSYFYSASDNTNSVNVTSSVQTLPRMIMMSLLRVRVRCYGCHRGVT